MGLSNRDFAEKLNIGETVYSKLKKGILPLGEKTLGKIAKALPDYNLDWIVYDKQPKYKSLKLVSDENPTLIKSNAIMIGEIESDDESSPYIDMGNGQYTMIVPIVPIRAQAGYIEHYNDERFIQENFTEKHSFTVSRVYRGRYMAFIVDGDSMDNGVAGEAIQEGSTITGREIQRQLWKNKFHIHRYKDYVIVHKDGIYVKQISKHDTENGVITCHSLNQDYEDFDLNLDECLQIFNVVNVTQTR